MLKAVVGIKLKVDLIVQSQLRFVASAITSAFSMTLKNGGFLKFAKDIKMEVDLHGMKFNCKRFCSNVSEH